VSEHPADEQLVHFMRGQLRREDVLSLVNHLDDCTQCRDAAAANEQMLRSSVALEADLLQSAKKNVARGVWDSMRWPLAAAAAVTVVLIGMNIFLARRPVPPPQQRSERPVARMSKPIVAPSGNGAQSKWSTVVADALRDGGIALPAALADLQLAADPERASAESQAQWLEPTAAIVETTRPEFRWTPADDATYVVSVFEDQKLVAESPVLDKATWLPDRDLPRGRVYHWQVEARDRNGDANILPSPPAPPALFRVLDAASHEELKKARAAHENDPLLLGVLYARKGLRSEAERELARVETPEGRRLLQSVREWSGAENRN